MMLLLMVLLGSVALASTRVVATASDAVYHDHLLPTRAMAHALGAFGALDVELLRSLAGPTGGHREGVGDQRAQPQRDAPEGESASAGLEQALADYEASPLHSTTAEERTRLRAGADWRAYREAFREAQRTADRRPPPGRSLSTLNGRRRSAGAARRCDGRAAGHRDAGGGGADDGKRGTSAARR